MHTTCTYLRTYCLFTEGYGEIHYDISYGGTFYVYTDLTQFGLNFKSSPITDIITAAMKLREAVAAEVTLSHPDSDDLAYFYGVILYSGPLGSFDSIEELCMFADGQVSLITVLCITNS